MAKPAPECEKAQSAGFLRGIPGIQKWWWQMYELARDNKDFSGEALLVVVETLGDAETMEAFEELRLELDARSNEMQ